MVSQNVIIHCPQGLHLREAARIVEQCQTLKAKITLCKGCKYADGCSILDLLLLEAGVGSEVMVIADGEEESTAVVLIAELVNRYKESEA